MPLLCPPLFVVSFPYFPPRRLHRVVIVIVDVTPRPFCYLEFPVLDHRVYHHIEDGGQQWVALFDASLSAEGFSVVTSRLRHHIKPLPIPAEEV